MSATVVSGDISFELIGKDNDCWSMVEEGDFKGMKIATSITTGNVVSMSARHCRDANRWVTMPSFEKYKLLRELDLHKSRYIGQLHDSVCILPTLETLVLTRCERLTSLPRAIGNLGMLREVRGKGSYKVTLFGRRCRD
jgi:hypothetical protein